MRGNNRGLLINDSLKPEHNWEFLANFLKHNILAPLKCNYSTVASKISNVRKIQDSGNVENQGLFNHKQENIKSSIKNILEVPTSTTASISESHNDPIITPNIEKGKSLSLTHINDQGHASMVSVGHKEISHRSAVAQARVLLGSTAFKLVISNKIKKGNVFTVAQLAGINAAKQTGYLIPLCHPLMLTHVKVDLEPEVETNAIIITARVECRGQTGVEVEAIMAASVAACTVYDMCKAVNKGIVIENVHLVSKDGGQSGSFSKKI